MNITTPEQWQAERLQGIEPARPAPSSGKTPGCPMWICGASKPAARPPKISATRRVCSTGMMPSPSFAGLFALDYKEIYEVEYRGAFDMVRSAQHPFIFATLDGRLTETATGRLGCMRARPPKILRSMQRENGARRTGAPAYRTTTMCRCCIS